MKKEKSNNINIEYSSVFLLSSFFCWIENSSNKNCTIWFNSFNSFLLSNHFIIGVGLHSTVSIILCFKTCIYRVNYYDYHKTRYVAKAKTFYFFCLSFGRFYFPLFILLIEYANIAIAIAIYRMAYKMFLYVLFASLIQWFNCLSCGIISRPRL